MKRPIWILVLAALALLSGYLLSQASLVGKAGISLFYKEYRFLKVWWQAALVVFVVWVLLFAILSIVQQKSKPSTARLVAIVLLVAGAAGLFFTYKDFRNTLNHRLLGERFHLGGYLFWLGWMIVCLIFLSKPKAGLPQQHTIT